MVHETAKEYIANQLGFDFSEATSRRLSGGDINTVLLYYNANQSFVIKINAANTFPKMLEKEAQALTFLNEKSPLRYPKVYLSFQDEQNQYLLLEYVEAGSGNKLASEQFGRQLAEQHKQTNSQFGWQTENYIGSLIQPNNWFTHWADFYASERLLFQTKMAVDKGLIDQETNRQMQRFCKQLPELFPEEPPALLHGDLWGGNYFITKENTPFVYDPAIYFGHREMDLGMTRLFGGFDPDFYESYHANYPLVQGWENRVDYAQLYPNLVHLNLFGIGYLNAVKLTIKDF